MVGERAAPKENVDLNCCVVRGEEYELVKRWAGGEALQWDGRAREKQSAQRHRGGGQLEWGVESDGKATD